MTEYLLHIDDENYGPYHSEEQARYAKHIFDFKHPDLVGSCAILPVDLNRDRIQLISPLLLR